MNASTLFNLDHVSYGNTQYETSNFELSTLELETRMCEKCPYLEFFWSAFSHIRAGYGDLLRKFPSSVQMQENTNKKKLRITTRFTRSAVHNSSASCKIKHAETAL